MMVPAAIITRINIDSRRYIIGARIVWSWIVAIRPSIVIWSNAYVHARTIGNAAAH